MQQTFVWNFRKKASRINIPDCEIGQVKWQSPNIHEKAIAEVVVAFLSEVLKELRTQNHQLQEGTIVLSSGLLEP